MKSRFSLILIGCVVIFGGILFFTKKDASAPTTSNGQAVKASTHARGEGQKKVTVTEYGDFQCPACAGYYSVVEEVFKKYEKDITFQFRNFPLRSIHPNAMAAHRAAEAASNQNKFWEMYGQLYSTQTAWSSLSDASATFRSYAQSLGLDMTKYDADVKSEATNGILNADIAEGTKLDVTGTPTFFIEGKKIENPRDAESFYKLIDEAIAAKNQAQ
jgi:protein-disulfide isomerase